MLVFGSPYQAVLVTSPRASGTVQATVQDGHGHLVVPDEGPTFHSSNPDVLMVDPDGHWTAFGPGGPAQIIAEARVGSTELTAAISVAFACTLELTVQMAPTAITLNVGDHFTPVMTLKSCGGLVTVPATITWSTADSGVLSVNPQTGETTALQSGTGTVRGTASSIASAISGSVAVTVR